MSGYRDCACRDCFEIAIGESEGSMTNEAILDKIRKLLKLSEGANAVGSIHEATAAAARAQALLFEHKLDMADVPIGSDDPEPIKQHEVGYQERGSRITRWRLSLLSTVVAHNFCRIAWRNLDNATCNVIGRESDVQTVRYLFAFLAVEIDRLCLADLKIRRLDKGSAKTWANNFRHGAVEAVGAKLREMAAARRRAATVDATADHGRALMVIDREKAALDLYYQQNIEGKVRRGAGSYHRGNNAARAAGRAAGSGINFNSQISGGRTKALPGK